MNGVLVRKSSDGAGLGDLEGVLLGKSNRRLAWCGGGGKEIGKNPDGTGLKDVEIFFSEIVEWAPGWGNGRVV